MVKFSFKTLAGYGLILSSVMGCSTSPSPPPSAASPVNQGTLVFRANGEDFVRQGFVSKDGWQIQFNHLYISLAEVTAYQTDPPFNSEVDQEIKATQTILFTPAKIVDLAAGDETAEPILVYERNDVPPGTYNALSWRMVAGTEAPAVGHSLVLDGRAEKEGKKISFIVKINQEYQYSCGEFVGDERKGIVMPGKSAQLEATFHFDHIFGDGEAAPDDPINTGALGFDPLATLASNGILEIEETMLREKLAPEDMKRLEDTLQSLGHVGEGHCRESQIIHQKHEEN